MGNAGTSGYRSGMHLEKINCGSYIESSDISQYIRSGSQASNLGSLLREARYLLERKGQCGDCEIRVVSTNNGDVLFYAGDPDTVYVIIMDNDTQMAATCNSNDVALVHQNNGKSVWQGNFENFESVCFDHDN